MAIFVYIWLCFEAYIVYLMIISKVLEVQTSLVF